MNEGKSNDTRVDAQLFVITLIAALSLYMLYLGVSGLVSGETKVIGNKWELFGTARYASGISGVLISFGYIGIGLSLWAYPLCKYRIVHPLFRDFIIGISFLLLVAGYISLCL